MRIILKNSLLLLGLALFVSYYTACSCSKTKKGTQDSGDNDSGATTDTNIGDIGDIEPGARLTTQNRTYSFTGTCTVNVTAVRASINSGDFVDVSDDADCSDRTWAATFTLTLGLNQISFRFYTSEDVYSEILIEVTLETHLRRWFLQSDGDDAVTDIADTTDAEGNGRIITIGITGGSGNLDISSIGQLNTIGSPGDGFLLVHDRSGLALYNKRFTGPGTMTMPDVKLLSDSTFVIVGSVAGNDASNEIDLDPAEGSNAYVNTNNDSEDGFILHLNTDASYDWSIVLDSSADDRVTTVDTLANGNIIVGGCVSGTTDFDPASTSGGLQTYTYANSGENIFIAVYDPNGNWVDSKQISTNGDSCILGSGKDANGNIYYVGYFSHDAAVDFDITASSGTNTTSAGGKDYFILKLNNAGAFVSVQTKGTTDDEFLNAVSFDSNNNIYFAGAFTGASFNPNFGAGGSALSNSGLQAAFVMKVSGTNFSWASVFNPVAGAQTMIHSIATDAAGRNWVPVVTDGDLDLDPGTDTLTYSHTGNTSTAFVKIGVDGEYLTHYAEETDDTQKILTIRHTAKDTYLFGGEFKGAINDFELGSGEVNQPSHKDSGDTVYTTDGFLIEMND